MFKISLKIWMLANLVVFALFALSLFPNGFEIGLKALSLSALFSAPAIVIIYFLLRLVKVLRSTVLFSWFLLLVSTGITALLSYQLFFRWLVAGDDDLTLVLALAFVSGYASVLACSSSLHYFFQKIYYGNEND